MSLEWDEASVFALPIVKMQKMGLVMTVKSEVLGDTVVFAPTPTVAGEKRVVYTWREAYIIATAKPKTGPLQWLHAIKKEFPGAALEAITIKTLDGKAAELEVEVSGADGMHYVAGADDEGGDGEADHQANDSDVDRLNAAAAREQYQKYQAEREAPARQVSVSKAHAKAPPIAARPASAAYPSPDLPLSSGRSPSSLLPRKPSPVAKK